MNQIATPDRQVFFLNDPVSFKLTVGTRSLEAQLVSTAFIEGNGYLFHIKFMMVMKEIMSWILTVYIIQTEPRMSIARP